MKAIRLEPGVPAEVRSIDQATALAILRAIHRYAEPGKGQVKPLSGAFDGLLRLRVGNYLTTKSPFIGSAAGRTPTGAKPRLALLSSHECKK
ncbi:MAG TPA: hypothetical protein VKB79_22450 [Bryobacteraceae bacterium]|nr:hypothetical protein [Bryobacteraceae bacterium]